MQWPRPRIPKRMYPKGKGPIGEPQSRLHGNRPTVSLCLGGESAGLVRVNEQLACAILLMKVQEGDISQVVCTH
ncbi:hypothetical protein chiPu_0003987 [Chiloscyllium punctatum]|uniref:Uncharacterized protein n=1 Tax=Chiloscyllium punctatum TaxID=137246 RepID=A0A401S5A7_CHIPU|nr:hypothetical protein [Chiloscyllium punctatum]